MARLELLGPPRWVDDRGVRPLRANRAACLVVRLASAGGWIPRDALLPLLWPDSDDAAARTSLRQLLSVLPADLAAFVDREGDALRYTGPCDVADATLLELGGAWSAALALHRGPFLDGFAPREAPSFDDWVDGERTRWAHAVGTLARRAFEAAIAAGATEAAVDAGRTWVEQDPLEEEAATAVAAGLRSLGAHQEASRALGRHRAAAEALGLRVGTTFEAIAAAAPGPMASRAVGAAMAVRGREVELAALDSWWSGPGRWCTIVAPGGMGKTTLVRAWVAARAAPGFDVDVVDLNGVTAHDEAIRRALAALARGTRSNGGVAGMAELVGDRTHALVVDGAEDLETGGTTLAAWLAAAPGLRLLVTSRRPLEGAGERVHRLGALSVARSGATGASVAADVLWARARAAAGLPASGEVAPAAVQHAVERVGGWPLGLDLLAGWAAWLGLERWLTALERDELFDRDTDGSDDGSRAIAASWRHLDGPRQEAVGALAGLPRPFELEDARGVGVSLTVLGDLTAMGWITAADGAFTIHPLLVAHARDQRPDRAATAAAVHARLVLDRHVDAYARTGRPPPGTWTRIHHLTAAWDHACSVGDVAVLARGLRPLMHALIDARRQDDLEWCVARVRAALDQRSSAEDVPEAGARLVRDLELDLAVLRVQSVDETSPATAAQLERLEAAARARGDALAIARIEAKRAIVAYAEDADFERAEHVARRALATLGDSLDGSSDRPARAVAAQLANLVGLAAGEQGHDDEMRTWIERAERHAHAAGGPSLAAGWGHNLAYLDIRHGSYHAALARNAAGLEAGLRDGAPIALAERWHQRALVLLRLGDATGARVAAERLLACSATMHAGARDRWQAEAWRFRAEAELLEGDAGAAERSLARCPPGAETHRVEAELALALGDVARARQRVGAAIAFLKQRGDDDRVLAARLSSLEATVLVAVDDAAAPAAVADAIERALALRYAPEHARAARPATAWARAAGRSDLADELAAVLERAPFADAATRRAVAALHPDPIARTPAGARDEPREGSATACLREALRACSRELERATHAHGVEATIAPRTAAAN